MGTVTRSKANNINSPEGNSLAVFVDGETGEMRVKDVVGNVQNLSDFIPPSTSSSPFKFGTNATAIVPILGGNCANAPYSTIGGGVFNVTFGNNSVIGGGKSNITSAYYSTIGGGKYNSASGYFSFIGGGSMNYASGLYSTISGGSSNSASNKCTTIGGGNYNSASGEFSTISGGYSHISSGRFTTIGGGENNTASGQYTTIGGGQLNNASGYFSTVGGGVENNTQGYISTISGGKQNTSSGCFSTISGGSNHTSSGCFSTVSGGRQNASGGCYSTVGGGIYNNASSYSSTISGGNLNTSSAPYSTISGGNYNTASGCFSIVGGGYFNNASGFYANIVGGRQNTASGSYSSILGGKSNNTYNFDCAMIVGTGIQATQSCTTFMNCASIENLTAGCTVIVGNNKVLENANFNPNKGLFAQTADSTPITGTITETSLLSTGVGTLTVPANGFSLGNSFDATLEGTISAIGTAKLFIKVKTLDGTILTDIQIAMEATTVKAWALELNFTIRTLGIAGVASISSGGLFSYIKNAGTNFEGFVLSTINSTTFDTTISNTLVITAQWDTNNAGNSIFSRNFVLNQIF